MHSNQRNIFYQNPTKMILIKRYCNTTLKSFLNAMLFVCFLMAISATEAAKLRRNNDTTTTPPTTVTAPAIRAIQSSSNATINTGKENEASKETNSLVEATISAVKQTVATAKQTQATVVATDEADLSYSVWGIVRSVWNWIRDDLSESLLGIAEEDFQIPGNSSTSTSVTPTTPLAGVEGRTFGKIRRLQMALIPIIFKFGVLSAMVAFLVVLGMKTLFLVKVLILMNAFALLGKFLTLKTNYVPEEHHLTSPATASWAYNNWSPQATSHGWSGPATAVTQPAPNKEIHLHIHGGQTQPQVSAYSNYGSSGQHHGGSSFERRTDPYTAYDPAMINSISEVDIEHEINNQGPLAALRRKYPSNHRY